MSRRMLLPLRTWSGALLVCALFVCLSGLTRPAMAMSMSMPMSSAMPGSMEKAPHAVAGGLVGHTPAMAVTESAPAHSPDCPTAEEHCAAPKATLAQDGPASQVLAGSPPATGSAPTMLVAQPPNAPPPVAPPDLHRLCVSRT